MTNLNNDWRPLSVMMLPLELPLLLVLPLVHMKIPLVHMKTLLVRMKTLVLMKLVSIFMMNGHIIARIVAPDGAVRTALSGSTNMFGNVCVVDTIGTTNRGAGCAAAHTVCVMETIGGAKHTRSTMKNARGFVTTTSPTVLHP